MELDVAGLQDVSDRQAPSSLPRHSGLGPLTWIRLLCSCTTSHVGRATNSTTSSKEVDALRFDGWSLPAPCVGAGAKPLTFTPWSDALSTATRGRHLMLWSGTTLRPKMWWVGGRSTGVSGTVDHPGVAGPTHNRGGNNWTSTYPLNVPPTP